MSDERQGAVRGKIGARYRIGQASYISVNVGDTPGPPAGFEHDTPVLVIPADAHELDGTDFADPAWWRGEQYGAEGVVRGINAILDGKKPTGVCREPYETLRQRVWQLVGPDTVTVSREDLEAAVFDAIPKPEGDMRTLGQRVWDALNPTEEPTP